ncbi:hypothetical protein N7G274_009262 [Stereocaulon virgatum]|uniref:Uncharacterized protein n=1 Tax=Stereocaulon virgatum TaxID=373712 RepID=A0ABR4A118_9LECA
MLHSLFVLFVFVLFRYWEKSSQLFKSLPKSAIITECSAVFSTLGQHGWNDTLALVNADWALSCFATALTALSPNFPPSASLRGVMTIHALNHFRAEWER